MCRAWRFYGKSHKRRDLNTQIYCCTSVISWLLSLLAFHFFFFSGSSKKIYMYKKNAYMNKRDGKKNKNSINLHFVPSEMWNKLYWKFIKINLYIFFCIFSVHCEYIFFFFSLGIQVGNVLWTLRLDDVFPLIVEFWWVTATLVRSLKTYCWEFLLFMMLEIKLVLWYLLGGLLDKLLWLRYKNADQKELYVLSLAFCQTSI